MHTRKLVLSVVTALALTAATSAATFADDPPPTEASCMGQYASNLAAAATGAVAAGEKRILETAEALGQTPGAIIAEHAQQQGCI